MLYLPILLVLCSGLLHAIWNMLAKKSLDKVAFLWCAQIIALLAQLPWLLAAGGITSIHAAAIGLLLITIMCHGIYTVLLTQTYQIADLSVAYPIMRGSSLLIIPLIGSVVLGERLSFWGWFGVACVIAGIVSLGKWNAAAASRKTLVLALLVGSFIAAYTLLGQWNVLHGITPVALNAASTLGNLAALSLWGLGRKSSQLTEKIKVEWKLNRKTILLAGVFAPGSYLLFLTALQLLPSVARLAPMREIGTVFGTLLGVLLLHEKQGSRRMAASALITLGVVILGIWGSD